MAEMNTLSTTSSSPEQTAQIGRALGRVLRAGDVIALVGELGAGKTTLVRSIVDGADGDPDQVSSPTFVVAQEYQTLEGGVIVHIDAYRLDPEAEELGAMGWDRLHDGSSVVLIEWPEKLAQRIRFDATVTLTHEGELSRGVRIELPSNWQERSGWMLLEEEFAELPPREATICRVTGKPVPADSPTWPFADERARMADLYGWFSEKFTVTRPAEERDLEEE
jgi:tRNA threonylcarbamoyladenosine biosynthesis protein TsaE